MHLPLPLANLVAELVPPDIAGTWLGFHLLLERRQWRPLLCDINWHLTVPNDILITIPTPEAFAEMQRRLACDMITITHIEDAAEHAAGHGLVDRFLWCIDLVVHPAVRDDVVDQSLLNAVEARCMVMCELLLDMVAREDIPVDWEPVVRAAGRANCDSITDKILSATDLPHGQIIIELAAGAILGGHYVAAQAYRQQIPNEFHSELECAAAQTGNLDILKEYTNHTSNFANLACWALFGPSAEVYYWCCQKAGKFRNYRREFLYASKFKGDGGYAILQKLNRILLDQNLIVDRGYNIYEMALDPYWGGTGQYANMLQQFLQDWLTAQIPAPHYQ